MSEFGNLRSHCCKAPMFSHCAGGVIDTWCSECNEPCHVHPEDVPPPPPMPDLVDYVEIGIGAGFNWRQELKDIAWAVLAACLSVGAMLLLRYLTTGSISPR